MARIKIHYRQQVPIPKDLGDYFWDDYPEPGNTYLEKFILRILSYGSSAEIAHIAKIYPHEVGDILQRYREQLPLYRGLKTFITIRNCR